VPLGVREGEESFFVGERRELKPRRAATASPSFHVYLVTPEEEKKRGEKKRTLCREGSRVDGRLLSLPLSHSRSSVEKRGGGGKEEGKEGGT